jgi:transposase
MEAIPVPVRKRIIKLYEQGQSTRHIAEALGYCVAAVRRVRQHFKARGTLEPQTHLCGRSGFFTPERQARLRQLVSEKPDATLAELCALMDRPVAISTMDLWLNKLGFSFKKSRCTPPNNSGPTSPKSARSGTPSWRKSHRKSSYSSMNRASPAT